ncbi:C4-dicarboxylate TRAP transporter large permease protein DctM [Sulfitobacter sp. DSM 110093]|uniref:TRAP transporter permease n=1 Tax=Sulfitobacter sp. DSM 110093 TaxID=2883127 RepID=UPI001FAD7BC5|nr:TRAP transporter fused permease subunit [Sulfitobacter sp. DSM 110093]UOA30466.1 C4-dicarboxylate TRAP transporter large permease protein DctM [Sulfitobacter sp. DSM 110093]
MTILNRSAWADYAAFVLSLIVIGVVLYVSVFGVFSDSYLRVGMLLLGGLIIILTGLQRAQSPKDRVLLALTSVALALGVYQYFSAAEEIETGLYFLTRTDIWMGVFGLIAVIELTRRSVGLVMALVAGTVLAYGIFGHLAPGFLRHAGVSADELMTVLWFSFDGVFGRPMATVVSTILIFILFGSLLELLAIDLVLVRLALAATGRLRSGPAAAATVASGLFGTISGSAVANVVGTGVITIPLIKKRGFSARFAAAVESAASSGGQITPPIMGAVAFIMADVTGVPYLTICAAAAVPAILYYGGLFVAISSAARNMDLVEETRPTISFNWRELVQMAVFVIALTGIVVTMVGGASAAYAGFIGVAIAAILGFAIRPDLLFNRTAWVKFIGTAGLISAQLVVIVGAVGIVIGVLNMTGVGLRFASLLSSLADDQLFLSLILMAVACLLLGMGMPTVPAYLIIILVMGPSLQKLGVPIVHTHMFVLYFGVLSAITPPVALAAFAAAPIAGSPPMSTALEASRLALPGFVIPFAFIYKPALLLGTGFPLIESAQAIFFVLLATILISRACYPRRGKAYMVPVGLALAIALIFFGTVVSWAAAAATLGLMVIDRLELRTKPKISQS